MIFLDTETCGLLGPIITIQWAVDEGEAQMINIWETPIRETLSLIERFTQEQVCAFNLSFDWFHLTQAYTVLSRMRGASSAYPPSYALWKDLHQRVAHDPDTPCLKPQAALDLMYFARKGPMQNLMNRGDIYVRRVPIALAEPLAKLLTERVKLPSIYFARREDGATWKVEQDPDDPEFPDLYLSFASSGGLKALAKHLLGVEVIEYPAPRWKEEQEWDLFRQVPEGFLKRLIHYWSTDKTAIKYALEDVRHLQRLYQHWGRPTFGDTDSELAVQVACARWRGYAVDLPRAAAMREAALITAASVPERSKHAVCLAKLKELAGPVIAPTIDSSGDDVLQVLKKLDGPVADYARRLSAARSASLRAKSLSKFILTGRAHWDFVVTGTRSNRMAGAGKNNPQAVEKGELRSIFTLKSAPLEILEGGDFAGFEAAIAAAVSGDKRLTQLLKEGKKIGALFGEPFYGVGHDGIKLSSRDNPETFQPVVVDGIAQGHDGDLYNPSKNAFYAWIYGAEAPKLSETFNLPLTQVEEGFGQLDSMFPELSACRRRDQEAFCSMKQPGGIGTRVIWAEPAESIESLFGFPRFFTLENETCRVLFTLANHLPDELKDLEGAKLKVRRRDRVQTATGAVSSALYAAAFQLQAANMRAAGNHRIQATGAHITKEVQLAIWGLQPPGIHPWKVQPLNVHDEVECPTSKPLNDTVQAKVQEFLPLIPPLKLDWQSGLSSWEDVK